MTTTTSRYEVITTSVSKLSIIESCDLKKMCYHATKKECGRFPSLSISYFNEVSNEVSKNKCSILGTNIQTQPKRLPSVSTPELKNYTFKWEIPKFSELKQPSDYSPEFSISNFSWKLQIFPNGKEAGSESISLYLILGETNLNKGNRLLVEANFVIENQGRGYRRTTRRWFTAGGDGRGFIEFIEKKHLEDFMKNDKLIIEVDMKEYAVDKAVR